MRPSEQINDLDKVLCKAEVSSAYPSLLIVANEGAFHTWHCAQASVCKKGIISLSDCHHPASVCQCWCYGNISLSSAKLNQPRQGLRQIYT